LWSRLWHRLGAQRPGSEDEDGAVGEDSLPRLSQSLASVRSADKEASEGAEAARAVRPSGL